MVKSLVLLFFVCAGLQATAQQKCSTEKYSSEELKTTPA
jgi:hypothetical protein